MEEKKKNKNWLVVILILILVGALVFSIYYIKILNEKVAELEEYAIRTATVIREINQKAQEEEEKITLFLKEDTLSNKGATFILKNNSDTAYSYGEEYEIEIKKEDQWHKIETDEPLTWRALAYILKPKSSSEMNINFSYGYGELAKGKYRFIKKVLKEEEKPANESKYKYVYAEFEIES